VAESTDGRAAAGDARTGLPHVLLVEDRPEAAEPVQLLLEETGHRVTVAASIEDAIDAACADTPDVMLLDLTLPDGDGLRVLRTLAAEGLAPRVTVALTGHDDPDTVQRCLDAGCAAVLAKPVPIRELLRRMAGWTAA
jgi:two-component system KDP operon response regulator KdpE